MQAAFAAAERKLDSLPRQKKAAATEKLEQAQHSLQLVERRTESSASHQAQAHANELDRRLQEAQAGLQAAQDLQVELRGKVEVFTSPVLPLHHLDMMYNVYCSHLAPGLHCPVSKTRRPA
jgi:hypothetical protein